MPKKIQATVKVDPLALNLGERVNRRMLGEVLPRALKKVGAEAQTIMQKKVPDGVATGTRTKQTGYQGKWASRTNIAERFPTHMKDHVRQKIGASDKTGVLQLVGVTSKAKHVNFDHGDKAKNGGGRHHILWSAKGEVPVKVMTPEFRRQTYDVAAETKLALGDRAETIVVQEIRNAVASGELY